MSRCYSRDRSVFGHWEGDLLIFERELGHANVTSLVERKSRYSEESWELQILIDEHEPPSEGISTHQ